ncbi:MAG: hypothetical protein C0467_18440 [Planctomycetaceae bacterium]|nr:hypothetical protein [Planctomycetaceae bacterium]
MRPRHLLLVVVLVAVPTTAFGQARRTTTTNEPTAKQFEISADGTDLFRALLDRAGIKPVREQDIWNLHQGAEDVIVIVMGTSRHGHHRGGVGIGLSAAQQVTFSGGAAFIATDSPVDLEAFNQGHRAWVSPFRVRCNDKTSVHGVLDTDGSVEWKYDCPYVLPIPPSRVALQDPDNPLTRVFHGNGAELKPLTKVATNSSSYFAMDTFRGLMSQPVAQFPKGCIAYHPDGQFGESVRIDDAVFAVGGYGFGGDQDTTYRFLAMADQSVFINQMLIEPGTQNLELTYRVIEYLQGPDKRKRCLFIENGRVIERFDELRQAFATPKPPLPMPNLGAMQDKLVDLGNKLVGDMQERDVFNKLLMRAFGLPAIVRLLLLLGALYGMWFLLRRMFTARKPTDIPHPPAVAGVPSGPPGVFDRRQKELVRRNNIYEPVRDMVREFFTSLGVHGEQGPKLPTLVISKVVRKPDSLRAAIKDFWKLAYGPPQEVSVNRWRELDVYFERVQIAHADGKWHFVLDATTVS